MPQTAPQIRSNITSLGARRLTTRQVVLASLVGTTIEFYDFYVFATAAALVIGPVFFPAEAPGAQALSAFLTFGVAFLARPFGALLFGHFGDRIGRKSTLVASMMVMGLSTTLIGFLPGYDALGAWAPLLLCGLRIGQGVGLGGEWGGAALLATENAPPGRRAWFGMFPQLGAPIGLLLANGLFLILAWRLTDAQFAQWGWRVPFFVSALLVGLGLYVRVNLTETPAFAAMQSHDGDGRAVGGGSGRAESRGVAKLPLLDTLRRHMGAVALGAGAMVVCYVLFYLVTVFAPNHLIQTHAMTRRQTLLLLCLAAPAMAIAIPVSAALADRFGRRLVLAGAALLAASAGFLLPGLLGAGAPGPIWLFMAGALALLGLCYAPIGALLSELFPTRVRYTGASMAFNLGGIVGGSLTPYAAQRLLQAGGLPWVGWYVTGAALLSLACVLLMRETSEVDLTDDTDAPVSSSRIAAPA